MSHCARLVLQEKGITADIEYYDTENPPRELLKENPSGASPTLIERDLVLYESRIIMEYLDERFPHPPLHQMDPVSRANARMLIKKLIKNGINCFMMSFTLVKKISESEKNVA